MQVASPSASVFILARRSVNQFPLAQGRAATCDGKLAELGVHQFDYNQVVLDRKLAVARFFQPYPGKGRRRYVLYPVKDAFERRSAKIVGSVKRRHIGRRGSGERIESGAIFFGIDSFARVRVIDIPPASLAMKPCQHGARLQDRGLDDECRIGRNWSGRAFNRHRQGRRRRERERERALDRF